MRNRPFCDSDDMDATGFPELPVFSLEDGAAEQAVAEILQEVISSHLPIPEALRNAEGDYSLIWSRGDITLSLDVDCAGNMNFECFEKHRDPDGDVMGTEITRGFLTDTSAIDLLMVMLYRPESKEA